MFSIFIKVFTLAFLGLAFLGFSWGMLSVTGRHLPLHPHPMMVRLRFFAFGLFLALYSQGYDWRHPDTIGLITATLLLVSAIRVRSTHQTDSDALPVGR